MPASTPLAEAVRRADEAGARAIVVVDHENKPIAIVNESRGDGHPDRSAGPGSTSARWPGRSTRAWCSTPTSAGWRCSTRCSRAPASEYLLVEESGEVYGVLAARDLDQVFAGV